MWLRRIDMLDKVTVKRTKGKQTLKSYRNAYSSELWLNGKEAVEQGYADEVVIAKCDLSLKGTKEVVFNMSYFKVIVEMSKCPLNTNPLGVRANIITNKGEMSLQEFILKNGKFGDKCIESDQEEKKEAYYGTVIKKKKAELCSYNKKLTIEKIKQAMLDKEKYMSRDLRNHIEYSY